MKKYLKNKDGMALPMVLIIMTILITFASGLAVLAYNSYVSVRWMNAEKQAYYLARAGVEAASYAYQDSVGQASPTGTTSTVDRFVYVGKNGGDDAVITSSNVYVYYTKSDTANTGTVWDGFEFSLDPSSVGNPNYLGYFTVEIGNGTDLIRVKDDASADGYTEEETSVKVFKSTAVVLDDSTEQNVQQTVYGYIAPSESVGETVLYDANGILKKEVGTDAFTKMEEQTIYYETLAIDGSDSFIKRLFKGLINQVYKQFANLKDKDGNKVFPNIPGNRILKMYIKISKSDLILPKPSNSDYIKGGPKPANTAGGDYGDNFYTISTTGNLFLKDVGIDATPEKGQYTSIGLYGNEIIIDGNVVLYAYITDPDSLWGDALAGTAALLGNRFRLGTVVLGHGAVETNMLKKNTGVTNEQGSPVPANKVYFNGNVVLKVYVQGGGVETYRVFNAGDMAYFYGSYTETDSVNTNAGTQEITASGIDLLKYFVDAVIDGRDGYHIYSAAVVEKMEKIKEIYYGEDTKSYFQGSAVIFKRLQVQTDNNGHVYVNGETGRIDEIIQPMPSDASTISWGRPRAGDVFEN